MKKVIMFMLAADAATGGAIVKAIGPTSAKLLELRAAKKSAWAEMIKHEDPDSKDAIEAKLSVYNAEQAIKAEISVIKTAEAKAILDEKRNAKVALMDNYDTAKEAARVAKGADKVAADEAVAASREVIVNALLSTVSGGAIKSVTAGATGGVAKGATSKAIVERFLANRAAGLDDTANKKEIEEVGGFSRGTTGAAVLAWQKDNGEKA